MIKRFLTFRVWLLIATLVFAILAINPSPWAEGVQIKSIKEGSPLLTAGVKTGENIFAINKKEITTLADVKTALEELQFTLVNITLETNQGTINHAFYGDLGFSYDQNLTIIATAENSAIQKGMIIKKINNQEVQTDKDVQDLIKTLVKKQKFTLTTDKNEYALLIAELPAFEVSLAAKSNIKMGLDLQGGTRVLLRPVTEAGETATNQQITDLIDVLDNRLNVYGIADLKIRSASDLAGNKFVVVEIADASQEDVRDLIGKQGKFEAKIGDDVVFRGGKGDVPFVCRNDGSCSGIRPPCNQLGQEQWTCTFEFAISLSDEAAKRHAAITGNLSVNVSATGDYLSKTIDFYLDDQLVDQLQIGADLKGRETTQIAISGPGFGANEKVAYENAIQQMNKLQTILITGSLPLKLQIEKVDSISPVLGKAFIKNSFFTGFIAILAVGAVIFIRYRKMKIVIPMAITIISEVIITLGVAAFIKWNIDLASIAGIIAGVGTGINDQIVIIDEITKQAQYLSWKEKLKRAFFIILTAYATVIAAMLPLWNAGAGLVRGFAVTTIIGITIGVLITRPAYSSIIEKLMENEQQK